MSDDKAKQGRNRDFVAGGENYEVQHFAKKHGISFEQARELIERYGKQP